MSARQDEIRQAMRAEHDANQQVQWTLEALADAIERSTLWRYGDGEGGIVLERLALLLQDRGILPEGSYFQINEPARPGTTKRRPIPYSKRKKILERDECRCRGCGSHIDLTIDHIHPVVAGGSDADENLQTLCRSCNSTKGVRQ